MKIFLFTLISTLFLLTSCATVNVRTDYDTQANFGTYKTFAFFKPSVDKLEISDLDKKRILRAVESAMIAKGFVKSATPDLLVGINTKAQTLVHTYQNNVGFGWGWGWNPFWAQQGFRNTYETVEGTLYLDLIDANKKELIWQGIGKAPLVEGPEAKEERINEIVTSILAKYPPEAIAAK